MCFFAPLCSLCLSFWRRQWPAGSLCKWWLPSLRKIVHLENVQNVSQKKGRKWPSFCAASKGSSKRTRLHWKRRLCDSIKPVSRKPLTQLWTPLNTALFSVQKSSQPQHSSTQSACEHPVQLHRGPHKLTGLVGAVIMNRESATDQCSKELSASALVHAERMRAPCATAPISSACQSISVWGAGVRVRPIKCEQTDKRFCFIDIDYKRFLCVSCWYRGSVTENGRRYLCPVTLGCR